MKDNHKIECLFSFHVYRWGVEYSEGEHPCWITPYRCIYCKYIYVEKLYCAYDSREDAQKDADYQNNVNYIPYRLRCI